MKDELAYSLITKNFKYLEASDLNVATIKNVYFKKICVHVSNICDILGFLANIAGF